MRHNLIKNGIDGLVVIGDDGSLTGGADVLRSEWSRHPRRFRPGARLMRTR